MKFLITLVLGAALCAPIMAVQSATGTSSKKTAHSKTVKAKMANKGQAVSAAMHQKNSAKKVAMGKKLPMRDAKGHFVSSKGAMGKVPAGATAMCKDGTYSMSKTAAGTCSGHGGVKVWLKKKK